MFIERIIKNLFKEFKKKKIDISLSGLCHFSNSEAVLGHHYLSKIILKKNYFFFVINFLKHILAISKLHNIKTFKSKYFCLNEKKKIKIFITWGNKRDFDTKGNFKDPKTGIQSNNKNVYFFIIYEDKKIPKEIQKNISLVHITGSRNYFFLIKFICRYIFYNLFKPNILFHYLNYSSQLSLIIFDKFNTLFELRKIGSVHFPYEGQQFQNYLVKKIKAKNNKIKFVGYLSHMHSFQTDVFKREGAPDILYLFSPAQKKYLQNYLGWSPKQLKLIYSYRLEKKDKKSLCGNVYFSYKFGNKNKILKDFRHVLSFEKQLSNLNFLTHPNPYNKKDQDNLKKNLLKIYKNNKIHNNGPRKRISIVIGISTVIFFLLEHGVEVIHFHSNNYFERLNPRSWKNIQVKDINDSVSIYKLTKYKTLIKMKKNKKTLKLNH